MPIDLAKVRAIDVHVHAEVSCHDPQDPVLAQYFDAASAYGEVTVGNYNRVDLRAGFNMPLGENLALMVSGISKKRTGYLPETPPLYPEMTVREYLMFVARIKGVASIPTPGSCRSPCDTPTVSARAHRVRSASRWHHPCEKE